MIEPSIYAYVKSEESKFETEEIQVGDNWSWNLRNHVQLIFHLKNGVFFTGSNAWQTMTRAFKNIMEPMLNLSYWSEDIEVKDVVPFVEEDDDRALSFLVKKYHDEVFTKEYDLDELFDEITETDLDYGGVLVQKTDTPKPEVLQFQTLAFGDQTNLLGAPLGFKHNFAPDSLRKMSQYGWGDEKNGATVSIDELITLADTNKSPDGLMQTKKNQTPGKQIEVYIVKGTLPEHYLLDNDNMDDWYYQCQIIAFYQDKNGDRQGVTLYRKEDDEHTIKFFTSKKVHNRALGRGAGEALLHPQVWTNFLTIHKQNMLESASKIPLYTDDASYTERNKIQDMENLEITTIEDGKQIHQVPTAAPANVQLLDRSIDEWQAHAQLASSAFDPLLGKEQPSGQTFRGQERTVAQGSGLHERRRGQRAKFIEEIYRDWIIPYIDKEITKGTKFLAKLSLDELHFVIDSLVTKKVNEYIIDKVLTKEFTALNPQSIAAFKQQTLEQLQKKGNIHLLEILKGEFADKSFGVQIDVAGKRKDLMAMTDKLVNVFNKIMTNPYILQSAPIAKLFNQIIESSGLEPIDLSQLNMPQSSAGKITETLSYKDLAGEPNDIQKQFLTLAGIQTQAAQPTAQ
jgi:hypothetical protein